MGEREGKTVVLTPMQIVAHRTRLAQDFKFERILAEANALLEPYELVIFGGDPTYLTDFPGAYLPMVDADTLLKAARKWRPRDPRALRVAAAPFGRGYTDVRGTTEDTDTNENIDEPIVVLNASVVMSGVTLVHEMIHATGITRHSDDPQSIFYKEDAPTRSKIEPVYVQRLRRASFTRQRSA